MKKRYITLILLLGLYVQGFAQIIPCNLNPDPVIDCDTVSVSPILNMALAGGADCYDPLNPIVYEIRVENFVAVSTIEFELLFDPLNLFYASTSLGELSGYVVDDSNAGEGRIRFFWTNPSGDGVCLQDGSLLANMRFAYEGTCEPIDLNLNPIIEFAYANITYNSGGVDCERPIIFNTPSYGACILCDDVVVSSISTMDPTLTIINQGNCVDQNQEVCMDFSMSDFYSGSSLQFTVSFNPTVLEFSMINPGFLPNGEVIPNTNSVSNGILGFVWFDPFGVGRCADPADVLFSICFNVIGDLGDSSPITLTDNLAEIEFGTTIDFTLPSCPVDLTFEPIEVEVCCEDLFFSWNACSASDGNGMDGSIIIKPCGGVEPYTICVPSQAAVTGILEGEEVFFGGLIGNNANYNVEVKDANGDSYTELVVIGNAPQVEFNLIPTNPSCDLTTSNGQININNIVGGVPFTDGTYSVEWSTGTFNIDSITGLAEGNYCVSVTDSIGCQVVECIILDTPPISTTVNIISNPSCLMQGAQGDGEIVITPMGGTPPYELNGGGLPDVSFTVDNLQPGEYDYLITDDNGCQFRDTIDLVADLEFQFSLVEFCNDCGEGGGVRIFIEIPGVDQNQVNVAAQIFNSQGDLVPCGVLGGDLVICEELPEECYTLNAFQFSSNCSGEFEFKIEEFPPLEVDTTITQPGCSENGGKIVIDQVIGAVDEVTYRWNVPGETENMICDLSGGNYSVTISDGRCKKVVDFQLDPGGMADVDAVCTPVSCEGGGMDGALMAAVNGSVGGNPTYEWTLLDGTFVANTQNVMNVAANTYIINVTDASGFCTVSDTCIVENPDAVEIELGNLLAASCETTSDGSITINVLNGTAPVEFDWSGPNGYTSKDSSTVVGLGCGTYGVTVTDDLGCTGSMEIIMDCPPAITIEVSNIEPVICDGPATGKALAIATGGSEGTGSYCFTFSSGIDNKGPIGTGINFTAGQQWVVACDAFCCSDTVFFDVPDVQMISIDQLATNITNVTCYEFADGEATIVATGGDEPYEYTWLFDNFVGDTHTDLDVGWYQILIQDDDDCQIIDSVFIDQPDLLTIDIDPSNTQDIACSSDNSGEIGVEVMGGVEPFVFTWTNNVSDSDQANGLSEGAYCITVSDANDCTAEVCHTVSTAPPIEFVVTEPELPDCFGGTSCVGVESVSGGIGNNYTFSVNFGSPIPIDSCLEVIAGDYVINVFDSTGCALDAMVTVLQPDPIIIDLGSDITIQLGDTLTALSVDIDSEFAIDNLNWDPSVNCISDLCDEVTVSLANPTLFSLTVTDVNGCTAFDEIFVNIEDVRNVFTSNIFSPNGDGNNDEFRIVTGQGVKDVAEFRIYDRWGNLVFFSDQADGQIGSEAWDGRYNGREVEPGVYVYYARVIFIDDREIEYKGSVTVVR